jgi:hypothetical protein
VLSCPIRPESSIKFLPAILAAYPLVAYALTPGLQGRSSHCNGPLTLAAFRAALLGNGLEVGADHLLDTFQGCESVLHVFHDDLVVGWGGLTEGRAE